MPWPKAQPPRKRSGKRTAKDYKTLERGGINLRSLAEGASKRQKGVAESLRCKGQRGHEVSARMARVGVYADRGEP